MQPLTIQVFVRPSYGRNRIYAADATQAKALTTLTNGARTLEPHHITALEALGFTVTQVADPEQRLASLSTLSHQ